MSQQFETIILCGGYGTRLGEIGRTTAKPLLPVGNKRILDHIADAISGIPGNRSTCVLVNTRFETQFRDWVGTRPDAANLVLVNHQESHQVACPDIITNIALTLERRLIGTDLLIIGGDNLFEFPLDDFADFGRTHGIAVILTEAAEIPAGQLPVCVIWDYPPPCDLSVR